MKLAEVKQLIWRAVMDERERCAKFCDRQACGGDEAVAEYLAGQIRSQPPVEITILRPETAVQHPEKVKAGTIVAGQALIGEEIVDRKRIGVGGAHGMTAETYISHGPGNDHAEQVRIVEDWWARCR